MTRRPAVEERPSPAVRLAAAPRRDAGADLVLLATFLSVATWVITSLLG